MRSAIAFSASTLLLLATSLATPEVAQAQTPADSAAIEQAALDYIQGYYSGNPERMEKALHPELAKRIVRTDAHGQSTLDQMTAATLVQITKRMAERPVPEEAWQDEVTILDIFENVASVRVDATEWIDYLHLAEWNGEWKIVNVLWEMRPGG